MLMRIEQGIHDVKAGILSLAYNHAFEIVEANTPALRDQAFRLRYQVFCIENKIFDASDYPDQLERDIYDEHAHQLLLKHRLTDTVIGTIRVVPFNAAKPHLSFPMQTYCPHMLMQDYDRLASMAEISRACVSRSYRRRLADGDFLPAITDAPSRLYGLDHKLSRLLCRRMANYITIGLYKGALWKMAELGVIEGLAAMETKLIDSIKRFSLHTQPLGPMVNHCRLRQPVLFNMKQGGDVMREKNYPHWTYFTENGKLQEQIDTISAEQQWVYRQTLARYCMALAG